MRLKCRLIGHDVSDDYTESGHCICKHCNSHSYYNYEEDKWNETPLLLIPKSIFIRLKRKYIDWKTRDELPF